MKYFTTDFNQFFIELAANNHKDWFDANRSRYQSSVKVPFERFVQALIDAVRVHEPRISMKPSDSIFRINRDIRFSKDKSPYKLNRSALITATSKKDAVTPGLYVELGPEHALVAGGSYFPEKDNLHKIRKYIANHLNEWYKMVGDEKFRSTCGEIKGEGQSRVQDKALNEVGKEHPIVLRKQFYFEVVMDPGIITTESLLPRVMECYEASMPLSAFLEKALKG